MWSAHFDAAETRPEGLRAAGAVVRAAGEELRPHPVELLHRMRGVAGLELHGQSPNASPPAGGGTSAAAPPTRTAFAGIRASAPPRCPHRAGCRPRGCGQRYGLPLGVDESATGPIVAILREHQPRRTSTVDDPSLCPVLSCPGKGDLQPSMIRTTWQRHETRHLTVHPGLGSCLQRVPLPGHGLS